MVREAEEKRKVEQEENESFDRKKKRLEGGEKEVTGAILHNQLKEELEFRAAKTQNMSEVKASLTAAIPLGKKLKDQRAKLTTMREQDEEKKIQDIVLFLLVYSDKLSKKIN